MTVPFGSPVTGASGSGLYRAQKSDIPSCRNSRRCSSSTRRQRLCANEFLRVCRHSCPDVISPDASPALHKNHHSSAAIIVPRSRRCLHRLDKHNKGAGSFFLQGYATNCSAAPFHGGHLLHLLHPSCATSSHISTSPCPSDNIKSNIAGEDMTASATSLLLWSGQPTPSPTLSAYSSRTSSSSSSYRSAQSSQTSVAATADLSASSHLPVPFLRPQPRIQISSLLADPHSRSYHLEIVQQPSSAAEFGTSYLSRVPLTPPTIVRLTVRDPTGNAFVPQEELPFLVAHLSLYTGDGTTALDAGSYIAHTHAAGQGHGSANGAQHHPPPLYGNLVSTVEQLEDLQGNMGLFFLFPDVSIRSRGRYQLGVTLTKINSSTFDPKDKGIPLAQTRTKPFDAVAISEYVAAPPTRLNQCFIRQGARLFSSMPYQPAR